MDCGVITSKSVLLAISLIFWAAGAGLAYVGSYVLNTYKTYDPIFKDQYVLLPAVIIICVAVVMFVIGLIGCCSTLRESRIGLGVFLFIILLIFIAEVSVFALGFVYRAKVKSDFREPLQQIFKKYDGKNSESHAIDYLQVELQCCGISNYTDWIGSTWYNSTGNHSIPVSCCKEEFSKNCTGQLSELQYLNTAGCANKMVFTIESVLSYAMLVVLGFAIVKFFGMLSVCVLTCKRDNGYDPLQSGVFA
ncbi:tetraspanin-36-like [Eublepharis macularius]|uniref:Tetraspanin n=1 Tax=Eublepharis macularius TaxID=481883 RepID=A0AA97JPE1_EUBMA|nr:tetraspanin-36-like [Eublepharis macularius]